MPARARARYELTAEDKTGRAFKSVRKNIGATAKTLGGFGKTLGAVVGAGSIGGLAAMVKRSIDAGDRIQKLSLTLGASTRALSELGHAAQISGTDLETVARSMSQMQRTAVEAADGTKSYADAYAKLGINVKDFLGLAPDAQLEVMADRLAEIKNPAEQAAIAMELFGRGGKAMLPLLKGGAENMRAMREEAKKLGLSLSQEQADSMAAANDATTRLAGAFRGLANTLAVDMAPHLTDMLDGLREIVPMAAAGARAFLGLGRFIGETAAKVVMLIEQLSFLRRFWPGHSQIPDIETSLASGSAAADRSVARVVAGSGAASVDRFLAGKSGAGDRGQKQKVEDPQLQETNRLLGEMVGEFRLGQPARAG
jgi:hypothetical protein